MTIARMTNALLLSAGLLAGVACNDSNGPPPPVASSGPARVIVAPSAITTVVGGAVFFQASWDSAGNAYEFSPGMVHYTSSTPAVATAQDSLNYGVRPPQGFVTGTAPGSATITATSARGQGTATIAVAQVRFVALSAGGDHTCGVTTSGAAFCWGDGDGGALGTPLVTSYYHCLIYDVFELPCSASPVGVAGGHAFATVSASATDNSGGGTTCGLTVNGTAYCWGLSNNPWGDDHDWVPAPVRGGLTFTSISVGLYHTCGLTTGGAVCWGSNVLGELGSGDLATRPSPTLVAGGLAFMAISAGSTHTCGLTPDGAAYCWGWNYGPGVLGTGDTVSRVVTPKPVTGGLKFVAISAGASHTCALTTSGAAYRWGSNFGGLLGTGDTVSLVVIPKPVIGGLTFAAIGAGASQTCGLTTGGVAYCWGYGQLGPVPVVGGLSFAAISVGDATTCGLTTDGAAYCWGGGDYGQLGNGTYSVLSNVPTKVLGQP